MKFEGIYTPAITPLSADGSIDTQAFAEVILAEGPEAVKRGIKAGDLVRGASKMLGGGGGGKPDFAQGGGSDASRIDEALKALEAEALKG